MSPGTWRRMTSRSFSIFSANFPSRLTARETRMSRRDVEDVTNMSLSFPHKRFATIQSSWLEPRKIREMTIVGTRRMIVYDDLQTREKIRIYDARVERPPHYDTFAEFHYSYHYGDSYIPYIHQEEPLKLACQHFIECIETNSEAANGWPSGLGDGQDPRSGYCFSEDEWRTVHVWQPQRLCAGSRANRKRIGSFPKIEKDAEKDKPCKKRRSDPL